MSSNVPVTAEWTKKEEKSARKGSAIPRIIASSCKTSLVASQER